MKKFLLVVVILLTLGTGIAYAESKIFNVTINGNAIKAQPIIVDGKMYIPAKSYLSAMGYKISVAGGRVVISNENATVVNQGEPSKPREKLLGEMDRIPQPKQLPPKNEEEKQARERHEQAKKNFDQYLREHPEFAEYLGKQPNEASLQTP